MGICNRLFMSGFDPVEEHLIMKSREKLAKGP